jgi:hypothetical protein
MMSGRVNTSRSAPFKSAYLLVYKKYILEEKYTFYVVDNYAGIKIGPRGAQIEQLIKFGDSTGTLRNPTDIQLEINQKKLAIEMDLGLKQSEIFPKVTSDDPSLNDIEKSVYLTSRNGTHNFLNLPGGQINGNETQEQCIIREILQELPGVKPLEFITIHTPRITTREKRTIFLVNFDTLSDHNKKLFVDGPIPGETTTYCGVLNVETRELYYGQWISGNDIFTQSWCGIIRNKFREGIIQVQQRNKFREGIIQVQQKNKFNLAPKPGGNQDIYYKKYLKYKAKYLKLKESMKI